MASPLKDVLKNTDSFSALLLQTAMKTLNTQTDIICGAPHNINEVDDTLHIYVDMPGVKPEDIKVHFSNNTLEASGFRHKPEDVNDGGLVRYGEIRMDTTIPFPVTKKEGVKTSVENGVLHISINRSTEEIKDFTVNCA